MEKQKADFIIERYIKPLYGFAVNKTRDTRQAEELASNIILQVYTVLLKKDDYIDINNYIFKIAHNVWVRYCKDNYYGVNNICNNNIDIPGSLFVDDNIVRSEEFGTLRREIAFLSKQRRNIVMAYYYENKKIVEIADELDLPVGTVASHRLHFDELDIVKFDEVAVMRKDGGYYIADANIENKNEYGDWEKNGNWRNYYGYMSRRDGNIEGLKLVTYWSGESFGWRDNLIADYKLLYHFINGNLPQNERNLESYERLVGNCYLINGTDGYKANIVYVPDMKTKEALDDLLPKPDDEIFEITKKLDEELYAKRKIGQPEHMYKAIRLNCQNTIRNMHVFAMKNMLDRGLLKLPTEEQRKGICTLLFNYA